MGWCTEYNAARRPTPRVGGEVAACNRRSPSTDGGAPGTVRPTACGERFRIANTSSVNQRKGRRGRRPLRRVRVGMFQRSRGVCGQFGCGFPHPLRHMPQRSFCCRPVGCTVLGAPWSRDRRGNVGADGRRDRFYPRFPRRARLRPPPNVCNHAGTARAPLVRREGTLSVVQHATTFVSHPPVRGGVLDAPCAG